jgi:hypothetical protein
VSDVLESDGGTDSPARPAHSRITVRARQPAGVEYTFPRLVSWWLYVWVALSAPLWVVLPLLAWGDGRDLPWSVGAMLLIAAGVNGVPFLFLMQPRRLAITRDGVWLHRRFLRARRWHVWDVRSATTRALTGARPLYVWLQRTSGADVPVCQCRSVAEARWFARAVARALAEVRN